MQKEGGMPTHAILDILTLISPDKPYRERLQILAEKLAEISGADRTCIIINNKRKELVVKAGFPFKSHGIGKMILREHGEENLREIMRSGKVKWVMSPLSDEKFSHMKCLIEMYDITSMAISPLRATGESLGLIVFDFTGEHKVLKAGFTDIVKDLSSAVAIVIRNEYIRRNNEERAKKQQTVIAKLENALGVMDSLNNPLMAAEVEIKRLIKETEGAKGKIESGLQASLEEKSRMALAALNRMDRIIKDVKVFCEPIKLNLEPCNFRQFLMEILAAYKNCKNGQGFKLTVKTEKRINDLKVFFDREKMKKCLEEMITNACDAGADYITIRAKINSKAENLALLIVNNGEMIDKMLVRKIFQPFFTTKTSGTGMGLAQAWKVIDAHGGDITVNPRDESVDYKNRTVFRIHLPIRPPK